MDARHPSKSNRIMKRRKRRNVLVDKKVVNRTRKRVGMDFLPSLLHRVDYGGYYGDDSEHPYKSRQDVFESGCSLLLDLIDSGKSEAFIRELFEID